MIPTRSNRLLHSLLIALFAATLTVVAPAVQAQDISFESIAQDNFDKAVRDLGTAFSYVPADPAESHGIIGFNAGVAATAVELPDQNPYMDDAFGSKDAPGTLFLPKVQLEKGLPLVEVGGFAAGDPDGNARLFGAHVKYPLLDGGLTTPAVSLRGHGTQLTGVDDLDLRTYGGDLSISKGFDVPLLLGITPFAGYSMFQISGDYAGNDSTLQSNLDESTTTENRIFAGTRISLPMLNFVLEADIADEIEMYTARVNFGF